MSSGERGGGPARTGRVGGRRRRVGRRGAGAAIVAAVLVAWAFGPQTEEKRAAGGATGNAVRSIGPAPPAVPALSPVSAAAAFLALLDGPAREKAVYPLDDPERFDWNFVPRRRNGLPLKEMTLEQRSAAHAMLSTAMGSQGYLKANAIIELERILGLLEGRPERRDPEDYYVAIFGTPSSDQPWAWRFEGHHLSLSFSFPDSRITITGPAFMGANPARVPSGPKAGWRPLGLEEDLARALLASLSPEQRRQAVIADQAPRDIITGADRVARLQAFEGLAASEMTAEQREGLFRLVAEYVGNMEPEAAREWMTRVREMPSEEIYFAWAGSSELGEGHYYRVHAPTFLIEYDNTQNDANHVHSVWRDLKDDFGGDALARHYQGGGH